MTVLLSDNRGTALGRVEFDGTTPADNLAQAMPEFFTPGLPVKRAGEAPTRTQARSAAKALRTDSAASTVSL
jgi:hypothetical protein